MKNTIVYKAVVTAAPKDPVDGSKKLINEPNKIINEQTSRLIVPTDFPSFKFRY